MNYPTASRRVSAKEYICFFAANGGELYPKRLKRMYNNWIKKYWELIIVENFEEAVPLKNSNFPHSFF